MVEFFKKLGSWMLNGIRWTLGAAAGIAGAPFVAVGGLVAIAASAVRMGAAMRTWTKPIGWLALPFFGAGVGLCAGGVCLWGVTYMAFSPESSFAQGVEEAMHAIGWKGSLA
jgi:hypothetical protein